MDQEPRDDSGERRKQKKKKHHRSRSGSHKHKKDRGGSRDRKKDKEKKKHKSRSRDREERKDRGEERREPKVDERREERHPEEREERRSRDREDKREAEKLREKEREREKQREREKDKQKEREREKEKQREREKQKQKEREREKGKEKERSREKDRDRKEKDRKKEKDRSKSKKRDDRSRSRDKKQKKKDDRDRDRERSDRRGGGRERAREDKYQRWRKQANFRFDSPPKSDDSDGSGDDAEKTDRLNKMKAEKELVSSKADRKLYLGNLPPNITSNQLMQMLNSALKKMDINCEQQGDSIISAWISPDGVGHYAFVQFRSAQEATAGLALNGASLYGYQLKLGRPKQYIEYHKQLLSQFGSDGNIDTILRKVLAMGGFTVPPKVEERLVYPPSRVVVLKHVVTVEELAIDEEYNEIMQDVTEMAKRHGDVVKVVIPRPMEIDLEQVKTRVKGLGYIFIKYKTVEQAKYARKEFIKQMFSDRSVSCGFFPEKNLEQGELDVLDRIVIDF